MIYTPHTHTHTSIWYILYIYINNIRSNRSLTRWTSDSISGWGEPYRLAFWPIPFAPNAASSFSPERFKCFFNKNKKRERQERKKRGKKQNKKICPHHHHHHLKRRSRRFLLLNDHPHTQEEPFLFNILWRASAFYLFFLLLLDP